MSDADCCGTKRCAPTGDVCSGCAEPPFPTRQQGQLCADDSECVFSVTCQIACIDTRCTCLGEQPNQGASGRPPFPDIPDAETSLSAAEAFSALEATGQFDALYDRLHLDAQRVIPREAVVGWYQAEFAPLGPAPATAFKVRFIPWTWEVTGQTYPNTAEVAYAQGFADGSVVRDEVRLVKGWQGEWSWFFGRDRAFVEEQIARFVD
jgi:hypothetical protein